jgi:hypothetical protein
MVYQAVIKEHIQYYKCDGWLFVCWIYSPEYVVATLDRWKPEKVYKFEEDEKPRK